MNQSLEALIQFLDNLNERLPQEQVQSRLTDLHVDCDDLAEYIHFSEERYQRNFIHTGPWDHFFVLCWRSGHRSPIHDHTGSSCTMRILRGTATEHRFFLRRDGQLRPGGSRQLPPGSVSSSSDAYMHQVANLQPAPADLITLHLYSPPLLQSRNYEVPESVA